MCKMKCLENHEKIKIFKKRKVKQKMIIKKIKGASLSFSNSAKSKLIIYERTDKLDVVTSNANKKGDSPLTKIKRISKDSYINLITGEVSEYKRTGSKGDNFAAIKSSISKIRELILNNFTAFEGFLITLTYDKPVMDFNIATKDFVKFFDRLKYHYSNYKFEYLRIIEPHENGAWHIHVIVKSGIENQQIRFNQDDIIKVWSGGSIKISQITDVDGLARYFGTCHNKRHNTGVMSKTMQKQSRWHYYPANVKIIRVPCSCRVNPMFILRAFEKGADGVIMCGCHPGDCHYSTGNYYARRRMTLLFSMLDYIGVENGRTRVEWVSAAEGVKFSQTMNEFVEKIYSLGKNVRLGDLRCKN